MDQKTRAKMDDIKSKIIHKYRSNFDLSNFQDFVQQIELLECEALARFQGDMNSASFLNYYRKLIDSGIIIFILGNGDVSIPASTRLEYKRILDIRQELTKEFGHTPTPEQVAKITGVGKRAVLNAIAAEPLMGPAARLDKPTDDEENGLTLIGILKSDSDSTRKAHEEAAKATITKVIATMPTDIRLVTNFIMEGLSVKEMSERTGLDPAYFYRVKKRAIRRLSKNEELRALIRTA